MNRNNMDVRSTAVFLAVLTVLVIGFAIILADSYEPGMTIFDLLECFTGWVEHPYFVSWTLYLEVYFGGNFAVWFGDCSFR